MISVVIPLYNKETSIAQSLNSVLSQSYNDFEVVLVDDGSTDGSVAIVDSIDDPRIHLIRQENGGPSKARNTGVKNAKGEWILFLDADDELLPGALSHFSNLIYSHPKYKFIACSSYLCKCNVAKVEPFSFIEGPLNNPYAAMFLHYYSPRTGNFVVTRRVALECPFNEKIRRFEDLECLFRIYKKVIVYLSPVPVMNENRDFAAASAARDDIKEDFVGHLKFEGRSFWEKLCLYKLFVEERPHYMPQIRSLYPTLFNRYDLLLFLKVASLLSSHNNLKNKIIRLIGKSRMR